MLIWFILRVARLDAGAVQWIVSVAGILQLSSTWQLVLGVVGKSRPSSLEKKQLSED